MSSAKIMNGHPNNEVVNNGNSNGVEHTEPPNEVEISRYTYELLLETVEYIRKKVSFTPEFGIICGSGLGSLAECLEDPIEIPYSAIPHFPRCTVKGHGQALVFGRFSGIPTVCMKGRFHYYEGYPLWKCCMPIRVMKLLGVTHLFITNAAGGLNPKFKVGDIMLVKDHINIMGFAGNNPLQGPNDERFGPRFPPMNQAYNRDILEIAHKVAKDLKIGDKMHDGVYTCLGGPNFETVAELGMLKLLGADAVGMSTVHEVITATHCDMTVFAFSLITNACVVEYDNQYEPSHEDVIDVGKQREAVLKQFVTEMVIRVNDYKNKEN